MWAEWIIVQRMCSVHCHCHADFNDKQQENEEKYDLCFFIFSFIATAWITRYSMLMNVQKFMWNHTELANLIVPGHEMTLQITSSFKMRKKESHTKFFFHIQQFTNKSLPSMIHVKSERLQTSGEQWAH